jgi:hypothetical protein
MGNGSVNTFLLLGSRFIIMQQLDFNNGVAVFSMWSVLNSYKCTRLELSSVVRQLPAGNGESA